MSACTPGPFAMGERPSPSMDDALDALRQLRDSWLEMGSRGKSSGRGWGPPGGPGRSGGPWGPDGPFGAGFPWGGGRSGSHGWPFDKGRARAARGDARLAILALLEEGPRHGYQLIQDIRERSDGAWNPSPGSIYPALSALQDEGLIDDEKVDGKRVFSLTEAGSVYVVERAEDLRRVFADNAASPEREDVADLRELIWGVGGAALTVIGSGTPEQRDQAREILNRTRRDLYRILAEDEDRAEEGDGDDA